MAETMRIWIATLSAPAILFVLTSCSSVTPAAKRPADIPLDKSIGRGMILTTVVRTEDGREFQCAVDTGSPTTSLPAALERTLGMQLGAGTMSTLDSAANQPIRIFAAPKLFLGNTRLVTGKRVDTGGGSMAILGMDCLQHYCIQLDFAAGRMRFLDPEHLDTTELGEAFPLVRSRYAMIRHASLFGDANEKLLIDTGWPFDGCLTPGLFERAEQDHNGKPIPYFVDGIPKGNAKDMAEFAECNWDGTKYTDVVIGKGPLNLVGMRFLSRHLVTFNFPKGMMYLKRTTTEPLK